MLGTTKRQPVKRVEAASNNEPNLLCGDLVSKCGIESAGEPSVPTSDVLLSPAGTLVTRRTDSPAEPVRRSRDLVVAIRQRIESRLGKRIRDLAVRMHDKMVVLEGCCSTYYSKQLAQHAAQGVLEDEQLANEIVVAVPK